MKLLINPKTNRPLFRSPVQFSGGDVEFVSLAVQKGIDVDNPIVVDANDDFYHIPFKYLEYKQDSNTVVTNADLDVDLQKIATKNATSTVDTSAAKYQADVIGTSQAYKLELYRVSAELATQHAAGSLVEPLLSHYSEYFNTVLALKPDKFAGFTLTMFTNWILIKQKYSKTGMLSVGSMTNQSILALSQGTATSSVLSDNADAAYKALILKRSAEMFIGSAIDADSLGLLQAEADSKSVDIAVFANQLLNA